MVECRLIGSSLKVLRTFPEPVKDAFGHALHEAQCGLEPLHAKALKGFSGRGVLEIIEDYEGNTFRVVYTLRFARIIYVLHCFQKKSKIGIATPKKDIELIKLRLAAVKADYDASERAEPHE